MHPEGPTATTRAAAHVARLAAALSAEPDALRRWARETAHPQLADVYSRLALATEERAGLLLAYVIGAEAGSRERLDADAAEEAGRFAEATGELARLKRLAHARRERIGAAPALAGAIDPAAESRELAEIEALLSQLSRRLC